MSELTTRFIDDTYVEYYNTGKHELAQIYLKSEVDKVIAEKDKEIAELKLKLEDLQNTYKESVEIKSQIWERCKKAEVDTAETLALLEERNRQVGELKEERRWRKCCEGLPLKQQRVLFLAKYKTDKVREWIGDFLHIDGMKADSAVFYASAPGWGCEFLIDEVIGWIPMPSAPKEA